METAMFRPNIWLLSHLGRELYTKGQHTNRKENRKIAKSSASRLRQMSGANNAKAATYVRMEVSVLGQIFGARKVVKVLRIHFVLEVRHERRRLIGRKQRF
jgi:hypothetical protein